MAAVRKSDRLYCELPSMEESAQDEYSRRNRCHTSSGLWLKYDYHDPRCYVCAALTVLLINHTNFKPQRKTDDTIREPHLERVATKSAVRFEQRLVPRKATTRRTALRSVVHSSPTVRSG